MIKFDKLHRNVLAGLAATALFGAALPAMAAQITFSNPGSISIPLSGPASPYPSIITVSGVSSPVIKVTATIDGFNHTFPNDVGAILLGPTGLVTALFNGAGGSEDAVDLTWIFDDAAAGPLPASGSLSSGIFQPSNYYPGDTFPGAPAGPYATAMSIFNGFNPNGNWSLYVYDFVGGDAGSISRGWSLTFTTADVSVPEPATLGLMMMGFSLLGAARRRRAIAARST